MSQDIIQEILTRYKVVAIVGVSRDSSKDSYRVAEYLKNHGFQVVPVNPFVDEVLSEKSYKSLLDMPADVQKTLEVVDVFRPAQEAPTIVEQAIQLKRLHGKPYVVWMQLWIVNEQAAETAKKAGLAVIMDRCMMQEHKRIIARYTE